MVQLGDANREFERQKLFRMANELDRTRALAEKEDVDTFLAANRDLVMKTLYETSKLNQTAASFPAENQRGLPN